MALLPGRYPLEGCNISRDDIVTIQDATIIWPNFSGEKNDMNAEGDRNFNIHLTKQMADDLTADGWNVKCKPARPDDEDQVERCVLKVTVKYTFRPPRIKMIGDKSRNETILTEDIVGLLDQADIKTVDLSFVPYFWTMFPGTAKETDGVTAYLKTMYVEVIEDELDEKWDRIQAEARG